MGSGAADGLAVKLIESAMRQIDGVAGAAHALVDDSSGGGLARRVTRDGDSAATVRVAIGLLTH